jgi:hypothetical protein
MPMKHNWMFRLKGGGYECITGSYRIGTECTGCGAVIPEEALPGKDCSFPGWDVLDDAA